MTITAEPIIGATNPFVFIATNTKGETVKNIRILPNKNLGSHTIATTAVEALISLYMPLINRYSVIDGKFDDDCRQYILLHIVISLKKFVI